MAYIPAGPSSVAPVDLPVKTVPTGTPQAIGTSTPGVRAVRVCAHENNTYPVRVANSAATVAKTFPLYAKNVAQFAVNDPALLYCISEGSGQQLYVQLIY